MHDSVHEYVIKTGCKKHFNIGILIFLLASVKTQCLFMKFSFIKFSKECKFFNLIGKFIEKCHFLFSGPDYYPFQTSHMVCFLKVIW